MSSYANSTLRGYWPLLKWGNFVASSTGGKGQRSFLLQVFRARGIVAGFVLKDFIIGECRVSETSQKMAFPGMNFAVV